MIISSSLSSSIVSTARKYLGKKYDYKTFDCVHYILSVYNEVGLEVPRFGGSGYPPANLHLTNEEFELMPIGHSVFLKRKTSTSNRIWTHAAIIYSSSELVHCSRHFGGEVVVTLKADLLNVYALAPKSSY